jgi:replication factor A1
MFISDLQAKQGKVELSVEVIKKENPREFDKDGKKGRVCNFMVKDKTGSIKLSLWNEDIDRFNVGNKVLIKNGYVSEWQGEKQLSTGKFGSIELIDEDKEIVKDLDDLEKRNAYIERLEKIEQDSNKVVRGRTALTDDLDEITEDKKVKLSVEDDTILITPKEHLSAKEKALTLDELEESFSEEPEFAEDVEEEKFMNEGEDELDLIEEDVVDEEEMEKTKEKKK